MSRTYRRSSLVTEETLVAYVNRKMNYIRAHNYNTELVFSESGKKSYERDYEEYLVECERWLQGFSSRRPREPYQYYYKKRIYTVKYSEEELLNIEQENVNEYHTFSRDGSFSETGRSRAFKAHCAKDIRVKNRVLVNKIMKDDDSWEDEIFPNEQFGKKYIWDFW